MTETLEQDPALQDAPDERPPQQPAPAPSAGLGGEFEQFKATKAAATPAPRASAPAGGLGGEFESFRASRPAPRSSPSGYDNDFPHVGDLVEVRGSDGSVRHHQVAALDEGLVLSRNPYTPTGKEKIVNSGEPLGDGDYRFQGDKPVEAYGSERFHANLPPDHPAAAQFPSGPAVAPKPPAPPLPPLSRADADASFARGGDPLGPGSVGYGPSEDRRRRAALTVPQLPYKVTDYVLPTDPAYGGDIRTKGIIPAGVSTPVPRQFARQAHDELQWQASHPEQVEAARRSGLSFSDRLQYMNPSRQRDALHAEYAERLRNEMTKQGGQAGSNLVDWVLDGAEQDGGKVNPVVRGVGRGVGKTVGSMAADPVTYGLGGLGAIGGTGGRVLMGAGFAWDLGSNANRAAGELGAVWDRSDVPAEDKIQLGTEALISATMAGMSAGHATSALSFPGKTVWRTIPPEFQAQVKARANQAMNDLNAFLPSRPGAPAPESYYKRPVDTPLTPPLTDGESALLRYEQSRGNLPVVQPKPEGPQMPEHLTPVTLGAITHALLSAPPEMQNALKLEAYKNLTQWVMTRPGRSFVDPSTGELHTATGLDSAAKIARDLINESVQSRLRGQQQIADWRSQHAQEMQGRQQTAMDQARRSVQHPDLHPEHVDDIVRYVASLPPAERPQGILDAHAYLVKAMEDGGGHFVGKGMRKYTLTPDQYSTTADDWINEAVKEHDDAAKLAADQARKQAEKESAAASSGKVVSMSGAAPAVQKLIDATQRRPARAVVNGAPPVADAVGTQSVGPVAESQTAPAPVAAQSSAAVPELASPSPAAPVSEPEQSVPVAASPSARPEQDVIGTFGRLFPQVLAEMKADPAHAGKSGAELHSLALDRAADMANEAHGFKDEPAHPSDVGAPEPHTIEGQQTGFEFAERRGDAAQRKRVDQMTDAEKIKTLLTSDAVDLPNKRAFDEAQSGQQSPAVAISDADGLKAMNDAFGYDAGTALLRAKAEALKAAGLDAYHDKGDEFVFRGESPEALAAKLEQAREILRNRIIEVKTKDGRTLQFKGADFSYGTGSDLGIAETGLHENKSAREASGERARGELRGITEVGPGDGREHNGSPGPAADQTGAVAGGDTFLFTPSKGEPVLVTLRDGQMIGPDGAAVGPEPVNVPDGIATFHQKINGGVLSFQSPEQIAERQPAAPAGPGLSKRLKMGPQVPPGREGEAGFARPYDIASALPDAAAPLERAVGRAAGVVRKAYDMAADPVKGLLDKVAQTGLGQKYLAPALEKRAQNRQYSDFSREVQASTSQLARDNEVVDLQSLHLLEEAGRQTGPEDQAAIFNFIQDSKLTPDKAVPLTPEQQAFFDQYVKPLQDVTALGQSELSEAGWVSPTEGYVHRVVKDRPNAAPGRLDNVASGGGAGGGGRSLLSKTINAGKSRVFFAIEDGSGNRSVVSVRDGKVTLWKDGAADKDLGSESNIQTGDDLLREGRARLDEKAADLGKRLTDLPENDRAAQLADIDGKVKTLLAQREALESVKGRVSRGQDVAPGSEVTFRQRAAITQEIDRLQTERARVASAPPDQFLSAAARKDMRSVGDEIDLLRIQRAALEDQYKNPRDKFFTDRDGNQWKFGHATSREITPATGYEYHQNALLTTADSFMQTVKALNAKRWVDGFIASPEFQAIGWRPEVDGVRTKGAPPKGWGEVSNLPQLRSIRFEPRTREVLQRLGDKIADDHDYGTLGKAVEAMQTAVLLMPQMHAGNMLDFWVNERGVIRNVNLAGLGKDGKAALRALDAVTHRNDDYMQAMTDGAPLMSHRQAIRDLNSVMYDVLAGMMEKDPGLKDKVAVYLGMKGQDPITAVRNMNHTLAFASNDVFYLQSMFEKEAGGMSRAEAIAATNRMFPDYELPTRLMFDNQLGRWISQAMRNPVVSWFAPYHYGLYKAYRNVVADSMGRDVDPQTRGRAISRAVMVPLTLALIYPAVDAVLKKVFNDDRAKERRFGVTGKLQDLQDLAEGRKTFAQVMESQFTPSALLRSTGEVAFNHSLFSGDMPRNPADPLSTQAMQSAEYVGKQSFGSIVPAFEQYQRDTQPGGGWRAAAHALGGVSFSNLNAMSPAESLMQSFLWDKYPPRTPEEAGDYKEKQKQIAAGHLPPPEPINPAERFEKGFKKLRMEEAEKVFNAGGESEKDLMRGPFLERLGVIVEDEKTTPAQRERAIKLLNQYGNEPAPVGAGGR